jgi:hypothetical protein
MLSLHSSPFTVIETASGNASVLQWHDTQWLIPGHAGLGKPRRPVGYHKALLQTTC